MGVIVYGNRPHTHLTGRAPRPILVGVAHGTDPSGQDTDFEGVIAGLKANRIKTRENADTFADVAGKRQDVLAEDVLSSK